MYKYNFMCFSVTFPYKLALYLDHIHPPFCLLFSSSLMPFPFLSISSLIFSGHYSWNFHIWEKHTPVFSSCLSPVTCCPSAPAISLQWRFRLLAASWCCVHPWDPTFSWRSRHTIVKFGYLHESSLLVYYLAATFMQTGAMLPSFASLRPSCLAQEMAPCRWLSNSCWLKTLSNRRYNVILFCLLQRACFPSFKKFALWFEFQSEKHKVSDLLVASMLIKGTQWKEPKKFHEPCRAQSLALPHSLACDPEQVPNSHSQSPSL